MKTKIIDDLGKTPVIDEPPVLDENDDGRSPSIPLKRDESSSSDGEIEAPVKPKKVLSDKQKENLTKGREVRNAKRKERIDSRKQEEDQKKKEIEEKIVKKAISIKKKEIKLKKVLELSESEVDDEPPVPVRRVAPPVRKPVTTPAVPPPPTKPRIIFY
jgi:hypothetical protein